MQKTIEIKAMSKDAAVQRALRILEATSDDIVKVIEKEKSRSFLGLFNKEGLYSITIDKEREKVDEISKAAEAKEVKETVKVKENKEVREPKKVKEVKEFKTSNEPKEVKPKQEKPVKKESVKVESVKTEVKDRNPKNEIILEKTKMLLECMNLDLDAKIVSSEGKYYVVNLFGNDNGIIIGKKGKTLNSFEYLINTMIKDCRIEIDVEGFKEKRNETLRELGKKMAEKALDSHKTIRLNPMPPRERKIIHEIINKYPELDTFSEGKDPKRYIVIKRKK